MPSDTRQHSLSQARHYARTTRSDNTTSSQSNQLDPIGSRPSTRRRTHILTGRIAREVPHGTSQLSPHFKSNKTPHPGTAWLDSSTRTVTAVPFLLTSLSDSLVRPFSTITIVVCCLSVSTGLVEHHIADSQSNRIPTCAPLRRR